MQSSRTVILSAALLILLGAGTAAVVNHYGTVSGTADVYPAVQITEVMANPANDSGEEFVEVYNPSNAAINLTDWTVADDNSVDILDAYDSSATVPSESYAVITDKDTSLSVSVTHLSTGDDAIGNQLNNDGETVLLSHSDGTGIDDVTYPQCDEGKSYQKLSSGWTCASPTQGEANE